MRSADATYKLKITAFRYEGQDISELPKWLWSIAAEAKPDKCILIIGTDDCSTLVPMGWWVIRGVGENDAFVIPPGLFSRIAEKVQSR